MQKGSELPEQMCNQIFIKNNVIVTHVPYITSTIVNILYIAALWANCRNFARDKACVASAVHANGLQIVDLGSA